MRIPAVLELFVLYVLYLRVATGKIPRLTTGQALPTRHTQPTILHVLSLIPWKELAMH